MATRTHPPLWVFNDNDGQPLEDGYMFFGTAGADPETNPITVYWDSAETVTAAQPIPFSNGMPYMPNGSPGVIYSTVDFSLTVRNKSGALVFTSLNIEHLFTLANMSFIQSGTGTVTRTALSKIREGFTVDDFDGVDPTGATDSRAGFMLAVTEAIASGRDTIYLNDGATYRLDGVASGDGVNDGVVIPFTTPLGFQNRVSFVGLGGGARIIAGSNNMYLFRLADSHTRLENIILDGNGKSNVRGVGIVPEDVTDSGIYTQQISNVLENLRFKDMSEGVYLTVGPNVGFNLSYSKCHRFRNLQFEDVDRCVFSEQVGISADRPNLVHAEGLVMINNINTGIQLDEAEWWRVKDAVTLGTNFGISPNNPPTFLHIGLGAIHCTFVDCINPGGAATRECVNNSTTTRFIGGNLTNGTYPLSQAPNIDWGGEGTNNVFHAAKGIQYNESSGADWFGVRRQAIYIPYGRLQFPDPPNLIDDDFVLDDYRSKEDSFAPTLDDVAPGTYSWTYTSQQGSYIKIGRLVYFCGYIQINTVTTGTIGDLNVEGLPFISDCGTVPQMPVHVRPVSIVPLTGTLFGLIPTGGVTRIELWEDVVGLRTRIQSDDFQDGDQIHFSGVYFAAG